MSGPIVRKYGFPNYEKIFGKKEVEHGVEDPSAPTASPGASTTQSPPDAEAPAKPKRARKK